MYDLGEITYIGGSCIEEGVFLQDWQHGCATSDAAVLELQ